MAESAAVVDVLARVRANTSGFTKGMDDAQKALNKLSTSSVVKGTIIGNVLFQAASKVAKGFGTLLVGAYKDSVAGAKEEASMQMRLERLLLNTGGATREQVKILHQHAAALEASTVVSKGNIATVQSQLATFDLHGSTIATLTPAILDYVVAEKGATASADQFKSMTNGLASALNGQFGALARTGFVLSDYDKQMIKTGTEGERAAAIVRILGTTYRDFASINGAAATASVRLSKSIKKLKDDFGKAVLPVIQQFQGTIADKVIPVIQRLQEQFADGKAIEKLVKFFQKLLGNLRDFGEAIITVLEPAFTGLLLPAIKVIVAGIISFIKVLGAVGRFIKNNAAFFQVLVGVIAAVAIGTAAYLVQVKLLNIALALKGKIVKNVSKAFKVLNAIMKMNPIGFIIGAVAALATGFVILWNKSDSFRKMVVTVGTTGLKAFASLLRGIAPFAEAVVKGMTMPIRGFLKVMSYIPGIGKYFKTALDVANKAVDGTSEFLTATAEKVDGLAKSLEKLGNKKIKAPTVEKPKGDEGFDLGDLGDAGNEKRIDEKTRKAAEKLAKELARNKKALKKAVENYNDFLKRDFANSFMKGADGASDAVYGALDKLRAVFDAQAKMLSGPALKNLEKAWTEVNTKVRGMIDEYAKVAGMIEAVQAQIDDAYKNLEDSIASRSEGMAEFNAMLATPFGQPSQIRKAMSGAEASVDSIISQFDSIVNTLQKRLPDLDPKLLVGVPESIRKEMEASQKSVTQGKDVLINYFKAQTQGLIELAKRREIAVKVLQKAQDDLKELVDEQKGFTDELSKSLKSFAFALIDISKGDSAAVYTVTKTATGLIISQTKKSTNAVDMITKNLQAKLANIVAFSSNINKLLASGLNQEYIKQLLGAGPEAAGETAAALALAGTEQIATINKLYSDINATAAQFSTDMGDKFYKSAIEMAQNFAQGATLGLELIDAVMYDITTNISNVLGILGNTGLTNAKALVDALNAEFTRQANETVGPATQLIVDKIRTTIEALKPMSLLNAQAFMDGLIATLSGEDNKARYTASADQIRANIDTIMKLLAPEALTSGLGLIASLVSAFSGINLESVKNAAVAIKDSISAALDLLKGKGTQVAADLAQELYDKLLAEKARLVALAQSIAAAIAAALASAAASIGVDVDDLGGGDGGDGGGFDVAKWRMGEEKDRDGDKSTDSASEAATSAASAAKSATKAIKKTATAVSKSASATSKTQLQLAKESVNKAKNQGRNIVAAASMPNFRPEQVKGATVGAAAPRGLIRQPVVAPKMTGSNTVSKVNMPFGGQSVANVTINTKSAPTASQTKAVVGATLKAATSARKGK